MTQDYTETIITLKTGKYSVSSLLQPDRTKRRNEFYNTEIKITEIHSRKRQYKEAVSMRVKVTMAGMKLRDKRQPSWKLLHLFICQYTVSTTVKPGMMCEVSVN